MGEWFNSGALGAKRQIFRKTNIYYPLVETLTCAYQDVCVSGGKKCSFFGKFGALCFRVTSVLRFVFLRYYRRNEETRQLQKKGSFIAQFAEKL